MTALCLAMVLFGAGVGWLLRGLARDQTMPPSTKRQIRAYRADITPVMRRQPPASDGFDEGDTYP